MYERLRSAADATQKLTNYRYPMACEKEGSIELFVSAALWANFTLSAVSGFKSRQKVR